ncbi:flavodoxin reductase [Ginsengibacter hankyongi]|uniref:Flavodoxin reductase n=1 Tax=Ginsengibacter hankyongi TaxID=2607284 RepID=A0A5J5IIY9_9BACT|nr:flavodoxin reductase [Ginsengibacter hankyongi]KAA9038717.1 flavodoxin reductase [Ginsengibacter hankyongi]
MEQDIIKIKIIENITHDVLRIVTEKPLDFNFSPGQAADISINKNGWRNEKRPFTFTSLPSDDYLEFTIKTYPSHYGVTRELLQLKNNDELILHDVFGSIAYTEEGIFIAGGAGVTPFVSIFRQLDSEGKIGSNKLIFANKTASDIINERIFTNLLGKNFINILSEEKSENYAHGYITENFLKEHISTIDKHIYLCGPEPMMDEIEKQLANLGGDKFIIKEEF